AGPASHSTNIAEEALEHVAKIAVRVAEGEVERLAGGLAEATPEGTTGRSLGTRLAELLEVRSEAIVLGAFVRIRQHLVGGLQLFELRLGLLVSRVQVRVILAGELAVCRSDVLLGR